MIYFHSQLLNVLFFTRTGSDRGFSIVISLLAVSLTTEINSIFPKISGG